MRLSHAQSILFVPGARPDRWEKALTTGADMVVIDLEDATGEADKGPARADVARYCREAPNPRVAVRVNQLVNAHGLADLLALSEAPPPVMFVPKVDAAGLLAVAHGLLPSAQLAPLIESPAGLAQAHDIATAPGVGAVMLGGVDYSTELGVAPSWDALILARATIVGACARAGVASIDVPSLALDDPAAVEAEARRVAALGMTAKSAIHPSQIAPIHAAFRPGADEVAAAREAMAAFHAAGGGAVTWKGKFLEAPVIKRFERILTIAERLDA
jgi:citrate lyase beta subunit